MMNLSINLTLGSPGAESVLNTAPAPEDGTVDSFSLKLADELSEQELTPPIKVEDTRAVDPALLQAIAARQKLAADSEAARAKEGRVWVEDPLAGLPLADSKAELSETAAEDKPWFDIIEKAKSYGPALQANKTSGNNLTDAAETAEGSELADTDNKLTLQLSTETADIELTASAIAVATDDAAKAATTAENAGPAAAVDTNSEQQAGQATPFTTEQASLTAQELAAAGFTISAAAEQDSTAAVATDTEASTTADDKATHEMPAAAGGAQRNVVTDAATTKSTTKPEQAHAEQSSALKAADKSAAVHEVARKTADENAVTAAPTGPSTEPAAAQVATPAQQSPQTQQEVKAANQSSAVVLPDSAVSTELPEPELPATMAVQAQAAPANTNRNAAAAGLEKAPAANAFAEHLKAVNQTTQQQQQSGAEQQTGQGQAKAAADVLLTGQPAQPAATTLAFGQQLQQLQQAQPQAEHTATATTLTQPVAHSAATSHATLLSSRAAEATTWQAPLALTEPAAAQQLKDRVMVQIQHKLQTAEVQLHPEDMGSMQIKLNLQQDQLSVQFVVQQGAAKEALEQQMPKLRELLEQQGIALTEGHVEQRQSGGQQEQRHSRSGSSGGTEADLATVQTVQMKVSDRMVDFYA